MDPEHETIACQRFFDGLTDLCIVRSIKLFRFKLDPVPRVPVLPCLDHEAMLDDDTPRHAAAYVEDRQTGDILELVFVPAESLVEFDIVSAEEEHSIRTRDRLIADLQQRFPTYTIRTNKHSSFRGDKRVMRACRSQVSLREVLHSDDFARLDGALDKLKTVASLMEKESRVVSWLLQTAALPVAAVAAFLIFPILGSLTNTLGMGIVRLLQVSLVLALGSTFVFYSVRSVHLTEMANRVWKRATEYGLIVSERRRIQAHEFAYDSQVGEAVPAGIIRTDRA